MSSLVLRLLVEMGRAVTRAEKIHKQQRQRRRTETSEKSLPCSETPLQKLHSDFKHKDSFYLTQPKF